MVARLKMRPKAGSCLSSVPVGDAAAAAWPAPFDIVARAGQAARAALETTLIGDMYRLFGLIPGVNGSRAESEAGSLFAVAACGRRLDQ